MEALTLYTTIFSQNHSIDSKNSKQSSFSKLSLKHSNISINATLCTEISKLRTFCSIVTSNSNLSILDLVYNLRLPALSILSAARRHTWHLRSFQRKIMSLSTLIYGVWEYFCSLFCKETTLSEQSTSLTFSKK